MPSGVGKQRTLVLKSDCMGRKIFASLLPWYWRSGGKTDGEIAQSIVKRVPECLCFCVLASSIQESQVGFAIYLAKPLIILATYTMVP